MGITMDKKENLVYRIDELVKNSIHCKEHAEEALYHLKNGDTQAACDVISLMRYKINSVDRCWGPTMEQFRKMGIRPGEGKKES